MAQKIQKLEVERKFNTLKDENPREAAEYAYALAEIKMKAGKIKEAKSFGKKSIRLLNKCKMNTKEACAVINPKIGGILLPGMIHQGVVRNRLKALKL